MKLSSLIGHVTELYSDIITSTKPADRCIDVFFRARKYLGSTDRRFISETIYGMLRHKKRIEWVVSSAGSPADTHLLCGTYLLFQKQFSVETLAVELNIAIDTLTAVDKWIEKEPQFVSVSEAMSTKYSFPEWMIVEWNRVFDQSDVESLCVTLNTQAPMTIRVNTIKNSVTECQHALRNEGIDTEPTKYSPFGLHLKKRTNLFQLQSFKEGLFEVQDEGSQLLALLVDPKPTSKVIDACAGAGGKALALAAIMKNRGEIFAWDVHSFRLEELRKRIKRSGVDSIRTKVIKENESLDGYKDAADAVLVDAPCTGTGTIRRNPGMKWSVSEKMVEELHQKQYSILSLNAQYVKPGGRIIYATCSLMEHENSDVVERFLGENSQFELIPPSVILERYDLAHLANNKYFQLFPHKSNTDGFFAAVMKRRI